MKTVSIILIVPAVLLTAWLATRPLRRESAPAGAVVQVTQGRIEIWTTIDGYMESRRVHQIMSQLGGPATIVELIPDGTHVAEGEAVVRFDTAQLEREVLRLDRDHTLAREDMSSLMNARLPMELRDIEARLASARETLADELQAMDDDRTLVSDGLISEKDLKSQDARVQAARTAVKSLEQQADLTQKYLHPSTIERARATMASAAQELDLSRRQLSNCVIRTSVSGVVGYKPLVVGGEFRTARVGDTVFKNQPFMTISDMTNLVMYCEVPEAELTRFTPGCGALIVPVAFPDLEISGSVETISSIARTSPGSSGNQKSFGVQMRIDQSDPRLRSGMSAQARVLSYTRANAVLIPRSAVTWEGRTAWCQVKQGAGFQRTMVVTGMADERHYEVINGLEPGTLLLAQ